MNCSIYLLCFLSVCCVPVNSARLLCLAPVPTHSHFTTAITIYQELARRGHQVTVISPFPQEKPLRNFTDMPITELVATADVVKKMLPIINRLSTIRNVLIITEMIHMGIEIIFSHESVQNLLKSEEKFDAVILEYFWNEALMAFAHRFDCPLILISPMEATGWINHLVANPSPPSYVPNLLSVYGSEMSFTERLINAYYDTVETIVRELILIPRQQRLLNMYYPNSPPLSKIRYTTDLFLVNSHESINSAVPHLPNMIEIGGYHVLPPQKLPKELKDFMDNAKEGVVVFSLGSIMRSSDLPGELRDAILRSFSKIKQKVLWKFESDMPNATSNVKTVSWLPQKDILAHPNVACFISHGGALSIIEALFFGVPILGIPLFGDQLTNIAKSAKGGYAINLPFNQLSETSLTQAVNEILGDPKYKEEAKRRSNIMHDREVKPMDSAIYWIEYAIRHKGAPHLRSPALNLNWFQRSLLDVYVFLASLVILLLYLVTRFVKTYLRRKRKYASAVDKTKKQ